MANKARAIALDLINYQLKNRDVGRGFSMRIVFQERMFARQYYILGWEGGYVLNPPREEQRVTDAYEAGYDDGKEKNADNFSNWTK